VRGVAAPSADEGPAAVSARDPGALVCSPALAVADAIGGTYESGSYGTVDVHAYPEFIELAFGSEVDTLRYQGAGYFVSNRRDVVTFVRDPTTQRWTLRVFESAGYAYEFEKPDAFEAP
jgi:hypothetical protein